MKNVVIASFLILIAWTSPVFAWNDYMDEYRETIRRADEDNYRNRMQAIQEELLRIERMREHERMRQRYERMNQ